MTRNDVTCPDVTGSGLEVKSFHGKLPRSGCISPKTRVLCTFELLNSLNSQDVAVMGQETSRELT